MKERPILFNAEMVLAILSGRKTQTRRALKKQPPVSDNPIMPLYQYEPTPKVTEVAFHEVMEDGIPHCPSISQHKSPFGKIGDRLWVRETFMDLTGTGVEHRDSKGKLQRYAYAANCSKGGHGDELRKELGLKWTPSIHMPRSASRITLEITNIRVERLNDISQEDAKAEGCWYGRGGGTPDPALDPIDQFPTMWESVYGADSWDANPWVWVIEFKVVEGGL